MARYSVPFQKKYISAAIERRFLPRLLLSWPLSRLHDKILRQLAYWPASLRATCRAAAPPPQSRPENRRERCIWIGEFWGSLWWLFKPLRVATRRARRPRLARRVGEPRAHPHPRAVNRAGACSPEGALRRVGRARARSNRGPAARAARGRLRCSPRPPTPRPTRGPPSATLAPSRLRRRLPRRPFATPETRATESTR